MTGPFALISGGTRGMGLAFSRRLAALGYDVTALYHRDDAAAASACVRAERVDVSDPTAVAATTERLLAEFGPPAVLVNNAGINIDKPFLELTAEDWRRVIEVNLSGVFYLTRAVAPAMLSSGGRHVIVNVGATTAIRPRRDGANYCASKAGLLQLTKCLALELAPRVRVNCLIPGNTETGELVERFGLDDPATRDRFLADVPQGRTADVAEIADALEFLVGEHSSFVSGQKLIVDGGQFMW